MAITLSSNAAPRTIQAVLGCGTKNCSSGSQAHEYFKQQFPTSQPARAAASLLRAMARCTMGCDMAAPYTEGQDVGSVKTECVSLGALSASAARQALGTSGDKRRRGDMDTWSGFRGEDLIDMSFEKMADKYERTLKAAGLLRYMLTQDGADEGGEIDFPLKKEEDEAEQSGGAPEPEPKLEEKVVQEAEQEALPEAKPEDKQQPADPREPPPARGEPLLTQKGPEADAATGGGTGCGHVPSHALSPFRMSGCDVALGTGGSALRVLRVLRVGFLRVPGDIRCGLHVSRVLQNGRLRCRMKMTRNGARTRYSGDRQRSQQGRLLRGTHCAADPTHNRYNSTGKDDFVDK